MKTILILDFLILFIVAASVGHAIARDDRASAAGFTVMFLVFAVLLLRDAQRALK